MDINIHGHSHMDPDKSFSSSCFKIRLQTLFITLVSVFFARKKDQCKANTARKKSSWASVDIQGSLAVDWALLQKYRALLRNLRGLAKKSREKLYVGVS